MTIEPTIDKTFRAEYDESADYKLEWFGGNRDALNMTKVMAEISQVWDDLIDKDKPVTDEQINWAFTAALVYLPMNPFYQRIQQAVMPMWITAITEFKMATKFERDKDEHGLEIAHGMRFAAAQIIAYAVILCVGERKAEEYLPELWKLIMSERFDDYRKEHLLVNTEG